ncbi:MULTISPECIES: ABC transporter permease subunit [unclassified Achromobacter]|uniref:ABC transporter permease subunit n=1 Tax=unclassified Achromobacter TaxID=2626865 RepID=UPI000B51AB51|nr:MULTISPECIES: ABC transporter permease subunit [unclassified Achromobacter]OWT80216.1 glutathione ABC transporter permease GsiC [Achromobacter sp. HZ34]OWT82099.1 glutathione ABC transporter permease GsiC [Achromobacter sp. HZ28]
MLQFAVRRLLGAIPVLIAVSILVFAFVRLLPGDPARLIAGPEATEPEVVVVRTQLGLDQPIWTQYARYMRRILQGDLGRSITTNQPVASEIAQRFWPSLLLAAVSMAWATVVGVGLGVLAGIRHNRWQDKTGMVLAVSGISFPTFWMGLLLINLFSVRLGWLPTGGFDDWRSLIMPSLTLGAAVAAILARFTRSGYIEAASEDYVRTARMKGLPEWRIVWRHALRNALLPIITMAGLEFGALLGGAIITETVFAWPGLGRLLVDSVAYRDYPVIQALILLFALEFSLISFVVDLLYGFANPEVRLS